MHPNSCLLWRIGDNLGGKAVVLRHLRCQHPLQVREGKPAPSANWSPPPFFAMTPAASSSNYSEHADE